MTCKRFVKDRKGVSSLFIAIYIALLAVLLISTLFFGLVVSRAGLTEYLKVEQERMQENIVLSKFETDSNGLYVTYLQVNNTGAITVRIRALYIGGIFFCDPSKFEGDAYIDPGDYLDIELFPSVTIPFTEDVLNAQWTVTTERGTRSSEMGMNLWEKTGGPIYTPSKFYCGPLMILFDMFHWRSGAGPWKSGWIIPQKATAVTWRILLTNVDTRTIVLNETSCFTLVGNERMQNKIVSWYIDPELSSMTINPGKFYFVYYTWSFPYSKPGAQPQTPSGLTAGLPCINFLVFTGYFIEADGSEMPFGQTIPFEAVLITDEKMVASVTLTANPENIRNDGSSTSTITANVTDSNRNPLPGVWVDFYSDWGKLSENRKQTNASGIAQVTLTSSTAQKTASVVAISEGVSGTCKVTFTPASRIKVTAAPSTIGKNMNSTVTIQLVNDNGANVSQSGIAITVKLDWTGTNPSTPTLIYQGQQVSPPVTVTTDSNGRAILILKAKDKLGTATITASASGLTSGSATVEVK